MSIYLAWSIYKLVGVLVVWALLCGALWWWAGWCSAPSGKSRPVGVIIGVWLLWLVGILGAAFNIGDRQEYLQRSSFNATIPPQLQTEPDRHKQMDIKAVQDEFEKAKQQLKENK